MPAATPAVGPGGGGEGKGEDRWGWGHTRILYKAPKDCVYKALEGACSFENLKDLEVVPHFDMLSSMDIKINREIPNQSKPPKPRFD